MRSELIRAFKLLKDGNADSTQKAIQLLQNTVFSFSMTVCGHKEDAEDTMQEVLLKAIPYFGKFDSPQALSTWLYTVARNHCWMSRRRSKFAPNESLSLDELMPDAAELDRLHELAAASPSPERSAMSREDVERLRQAILTLPPAYRIVLVLHDVEELSSGEVAQVLNLKEGSVRVRLHRARLALRKELSAPGHPYRANKSIGSPVARSTKCKQIFANLSEYLDGALDGELCEELQRHMAGCRPCESFLNNLRNTVERTHALPPVQPSTVVAESALRRTIEKLQHSELV